LLIKEKKVLFLYQVILYWIFEAHCVGCSDNVIPSTRQRVWSNHLVAFDAR